MYQSQNQITPHNQKTRKKNQNTKPEDQTGEKENYYRHCNTRGNKVSRQYALKRNMQTKT
jgi:hypothetical protein